MSLANKFQLLELSDDEDTPKTQVKVTPAPVAKAAETKAPTPAPVAKKTEAKSEPKTNEKAPKTDKKPRAVGEKKDGENKPRGPRPDGENKPRGPRPDGENKPRGPRPDGENKPRGPRPDGENKPRGPRPEGTDRPRRPRRNEEEGQPQETQEKTEGGDAPKSDLPPKKRQFDRRGPRRHEGEKSEFHGKGNWGKPGSETTPEAAATEQAEAVATEQAEKPAETPAPAPVQEPEDKTITLSEFKKLQAAQKKAVEKSAAQPRGANEGSDQSAWKNTEQFVRGEDAYFVPPEKSGKKKEVAKPAERKAPETIEINPKPLIEDKIRERKEKNYGNDRRINKFKQNKTKVEPPKPEDISAFPKLK